MPMQPSSSSLPRSSKIWIKNNRRTFVADEMVFDTKQKICEFKLHGEWVARIKTNMYIAKFR